MFYTIVMVWFIALCYDIWRMDIKKSPVDNNDDV
jgi:hypothetical protein